MKFISTIFLTNWEKLRQRLFKVNFRIKISIQLTFSILHYLAEFLTTLYFFQRTIPICFLTLYNLFICNVYGKFTEEVHSIFICIPKDFSHQSNSCKDCVFHRVQMSVKRVAIQFIKSLKLLTMTFELKEKFNEDVIKQDRFDWKYCQKE